MGFWLYVSIAAVIALSPVFMLAVVRLYLWWIHPREISAERYRKAWRRQ
jgi:hypothetical protein